MPRRGENIHKRKDGRWEGRYIKKYDLSGKACYGSVYAKSYLEVKRKLIEISEKVINNRLPAKSQNLLFREVLYLWLENGKRRYKHQTYTKYLYMIESHIISEIGNIKIKNINCEFINKFLYDKSNSGRLDGKGGLSPSYIRTIAFIICSAIDYAAKEGYCATLSREIICPPKAKKQLEVLTSQEQNKLELYICNDINDRKIGTLLSLYTGLRIGEVCGLTWGDIDFSGETIHVHHSVERVSNLSLENGGNKTILILGDTKTDSSNRVIPIPNNLLDILKENRSNDNDFILQGKSYAYTDPRTFQYSFSGYLDECGIRHINFHALRHTFATRCIESGMDIKSLSEILGHASVNITLNTYVHSSMEHKKKQLNTMTAYCGQ